MQIVERTSTKLVLQHYPWLYWFWAVAILISAFSGGFLDTLYLIVTRQFVWKTGIGGTEEIVLGSLLVTATVLLGILSTIQTITFDATLGTLVVKKRNLLKSWKFSYPLNTILKFQIDEYEVDKYELIVIFTHGERQQLLSDTTKVVVDAALDFLKQYQQINNDVPVSDSLIELQPFNTSDSFEIKVFIFAERF
jgi:hypothetical protein